MCLSSQFMEADLKELITSQQPRKKQGEEGGREGDWEGTRRPLPSPLFSPGSSAEGTVPPVVGRFSHLK